MGILGKLAFWKKEDPGLDKSFSDMGNMDLGQAGQNIGGSDNMGMPLSQGLPDMTNFRGVGDKQGQQDMNQSINQQLGPNYMDNNSPQPFQANAGYQEVQPGGAQNHEIEVISAKLDAIKATMDAINQRLANLERAAYSQEEKKNTW